MVDFIINGYVGTTATQLADGQLTNSEADLYASSADATVVTSIILCNTHSSALTIHLYLKPSGGSSRSIISKDMSLTAGYSLYTDGQRVTTLDTSGRILTSYTVANLGDVEDITLTSEADHDMLYYDNATSLWKNATVATTLGQLTGANFDVGAFDVRGQTLTADALTSGRVVFAGASGVLSDDSDFTFATDTLTVTKITTGDVSSLCGTKAVFNSWGAVFGDAYYLYMRSDYSAYVASIDSNYLDISGNTGLRMRVSDVGVIFSISASSCAMYPPTTFSAGVIILPEAEFKLRLPVTDTVGTIEGEVWYDASENTIKVVTGSVDSVVLQAATQTLTNKTLTSPAINGTISTTGLTLAGNLTMAATRKIIIADDGLIQLGVLDGSPEVFGGRAAEPHQAIVQPKDGNRVGCIVVLPSGTSAVGEFIARNASDIENSGFLQFLINGTTVYLTGSKVGTGTAPDTFAIGFPVVPYSSLGYGLGTDTSWWSHVNALHHHIIKTVNVTYPISGTVVDDMTAGESLVLGDAVYMKSDGKAWKADADGTATMPVMALAAETIAADAAGKFLLSGFLYLAAWDWTIGGIIYASVTPGALSQTAPVGSGDQVQVVGVAITADIIHFNPSFELVEIA